jgi:methylthioribose-1-phosphate isomerase
VEPGARAVSIIDQTQLPHRFEVARLSSLTEAAQAIAQMRVRGAPLIGVTAVYGLWLQLLEDASNSALNLARQRLVETRPTAINLRRCVDDAVSVLEPLAPEDRACRALELAHALAEHEISLSQRIGKHGAEVLRGLWKPRRGARLNILTHCNAGWLATVDHGTALAPIYELHAQGVPVHVYVDETRPRSQGYLTAWELGQEGVPHTLIADNAGGHLMQRGQVQACIVGTDRTTSQGDVCNKIGTYLKALAAKDNGVPFYVAVPESSIDWSIANGLRGIPIEERSATEVHDVSGRDEQGQVRKVRVTPEGSAAANPAFDVTPARLISLLITERGACPASAQGLLSLYPERG